jgi:hypothetical protein
MSTAGGVFSKVTLEGEVRITGTKKYLVSSGKKIKKYFL